MPLIRAKHNVTGGVADVPDNDFWRTKGWEPVDLDTPTTDQLRDQGLIGGPEFDPAEHNVDDVVAHLASAGPGERDRVLAAERTGKARAGVLNSSPADAGV